LDKIDRQLKSHNNLFSEPIQESQEDYYISNNGGHSGGISLK